MPRIGIDAPDAVAEVTEAFRRYEAALMANDAATLVAFVWDDARAIRYGLADIQHGHAEIAAFRAAEALASPPRTLERTVVTCFGPDVATVSTLFRRDDAPRRLGRQTQIWARLGDDGHAGIGAWRIVGAHVSLIDG